MPDHECKAHKCRRQAVEMQAEIDRLRAAVWGRDNEHFAALNLLADIRAAAGDKEGKLMQSELVELIARQREECDQMRAAWSDQRST